MQNQQIKVPTNTPVVPGGRAFVQAERPVYVPQPEANRYRNQNIIGQPLPNLPFSDQLAHAIGF